MTKLDFLEWHHRDEELDEETEAMLNDDEIDDDCVIWCKKCYPPNQEDDSRDKLLKSFDEGIARAARVEELKAAASELAAVKDKFSAYFTKVNSQTYVNSLRKTPHVKRKRGDDEAASDADEPEPKRQELEAE
jgi:hypothetical protein